jgi:GTPase SAR1 family protein
MKILLTGTHGTGKSTLLQELVKESRFKNFSVVGGVTREARDLGLKINSSGEDSTQYYCMARDVLNFITYQDRDTIFDRSLIDTYMYTMYLYQKDKTRYDLYVLIEILERLLYIYRNYFDYIFWLRPEFSLEDDGVRDTDLAFQLHIDSNFELFFNDRQLNNLYRVSGSIEERVNLIKIVIDQ